MRLTGVSTGDDPPRREADVPHASSAGPPTAHTPAYDAVDLTTCDREPIHIPGAIQPHGVLLALDPDLRVAIASANSGRLLGISAEDAIGLRLGDLLGGPGAKHVATRIDAALATTPLVLTLDELPGPAALAGVEVDI